MNKKRPVNLDLTTIKFPPAAIISILHRISGVVIFLCIPILLWALHWSLLSAQQFEQLKTWLSNPFWFIVAWVIFAALIYHLVAGIRHLLMDLHVAEGKISGRNSAYITLTASIILIILAGVWLW